MSFVTDTDSLLTVEDEAWLRCLLDAVEPRCEAGHQWGTPCSVKVTHRKLTPCGDNRLWCQSRFDDWISKNDRGKCMQCETTTCVESWRVFPV